MLLKGQQEALELISIHAAQEGCDSGANAIRIGRVISIHAAQEGCDSEKVA